MNLQTADVFTTASASGHQQSRSDRAVSHKFAAHGAYFYKVIICYLRMTYRQTAQRKAMQSPCNSAVVTNLSCQAHVCDRSCAIFSLYSFFSSHNA